MKLKKWVYDFIASLLVACMCLTVLIMMFF